MTRCVSIKTRATSGSANSGASFCATGSRQARSIPTLTRKRAANELLLIAHGLVLRQLQSPTPANREEAREILSERFERLAVKSPKVRRVQGR